MLLSISNRGAHVKKPFLSSALCLAITVPAYATVLCVKNTQELADALMTAQSNGADDEIRIHTGNYVGGFTFTMENQKTVLRGGYTDAACQTESSEPTLTILDGVNQQRPLTISLPGYTLQNSSVHIERLTFQNGKAAVGGGLSIRVYGYGSLVDIIVDRNVFRNNSTTLGTSGGGLEILTGGVLTVRNNLIINNFAPNAAAAFFYSDGLEKNITNNLFFNNQSTCMGCLTREAVIHSTPTTSFVFANNIFWGNINGSGAVDIDLCPNSDVGYCPGDEQPAIIINNDIQESRGTPASGSTGNLSLDPQFINPVMGNFQLGYGSPLINKGVNNPQGGIGELDLSGISRVDAGTVDIGPNETNYIFVTSFD